MKKEEVRVVFDAYIFKGGVTGKEPGYSAYRKILDNRYHHALIISEEIIENYSKAIAKNGFKPSVMWIEFIKLQMMQKIRFAKRERIESVEEKVDVHRKDKAFSRAAFALNAKYIVTQDRRHFLSKKSEFKKYQIEVLTPEEYIEIS